LKNFASKAAIYFGANLVERHIRIFDRNMSKDGPVSIMPFDISDVIEFSKLSKSDQSLNLKENYNYQISKTFGKSQRKLSRIELLNRYYYRGRFGSFDRKNYRHLFNWEEIEI
jgi:sialic acid synthase SpsE